MINKKYLTRIFFCVLFLGVNTRAQLLPIAAEEVFDFLNSTTGCRMPTGNINSTTFWRNPSDGLSVNEHNGWKGSIAIQCANINYNRSNQGKYLQLITEYRNWLKNTCEYSLTKCETKSGTLNYWSDDAGWNLSNYVLLYNLDPIGSSTLLDSAYAMLKNADVRWGANLKGNSKALQYHDCYNHYSIYNVNFILGALELYEAIKPIDTVKAVEVLDFACKMYNFVENYLHSTGPTGFNIDHEPFTIGKDKYQFAIRFEDIIDSCTIKPTPTYVVAPSIYNYDQIGKDNGLTFAQMAMAVVYEMFNKIEMDGTSLPLITAPNRGFRQKAINAADILISAYPDGYAEPSLGIGDLLVNGQDPSVNAFACYWWVKYIVSLAPERYGRIIINTARAIITNYSTDSIIPSCWNSPNSKNTGSTCACSGSQSVNLHDTVDSINAFVQNANAAIIISAAAWIEQLSQNIMGFEDANFWHFVNGSKGVLVNNNNKTEGNKSLMIAGNSFQQFSSSNINTTSLAEKTQLHVDVFVGANQTNPYWIGQLQFFVNCPSANLNNTFIGAVELTPLNSNAFNEVTFKLPASVITVLQGNYDDFSFSFALNTNAMTGLFQLDNMHFSN